jgi:hypothetical protein
LLDPGLIGKANVLDLRQPKADPLDLDRTLCARTRVHEEDECALLAGGVAEDVGADRLALAVTAYVNGPAFKKR